MRLVDILWFNVALEVVLTAVVTRDQRLTAGFKARELRVVALLDHVDSHSGTRARTVTPSAYHRHVPLQRLHFVTGKRCSATTPGHRTRHAENAA